MVLRMDMTTVNFDGLYSVRHSKPVMAWCQHGFPDRGTGEDLHFEVLGLKPIVGL
jgi:hypothetical protein